jgi:hypothetical protein
MLEQVHRTLDHLAAGREVHHALTVTALEKASEEPAGAGTAAAGSCARGLRCLRLALTESGRSIA